MSKTNSRKISRIFSTALSLCMLISAIFVPVNAANDTATDFITNGNFETGDLTGFETTGTVEILNTPKAEHTGVDLDGYAAYLTAGVDKCQLIAPVTLNPGEYVWSYDTYIVGKGGWGSAGFGISTKSGNPWNNGGYISKFPEIAVIDQYDSYYTSQSAADHIDTGINQFYCLGYGETSDISGKHHITVKFTVKSETTLYLWVAGHTVVQYVDNMKLQTLDEYNRIIADDNFGSYPNTTINGFTVSNGVISVTKNAETTGDYGGILPLYKSEGSKTKAVIEPDKGYMLTFKYKAENVTSMDLVPFGYDGSKTDGVTFTSSSYTSNRSFGMTINNQSEWKEVKIPFYTISPWGDGSSKDFETKYYLGLGVSGSGTLYLDDVKVVRMDKVTFNSNGGSTISDIRFGVHGTDIASFPADPTRDGYTFAGWYVDAECTTKAVNYNGDAVLYADWLPKGLEADTNGDGALDIRDLVRAKQVFVNPNEYSVYDKDRAYYLGEDKGDAANLSGIRKLLLGIADSANTAKDIRIAGVSIGKFAFDMSEITGSDSLTVGISDFKESLSAFGISETAASGQPVIKAVLTGTSSYTFTVTKDGITVSADNEEALIGGLNRLAHMLNLANEMKTQMHLNVGVYPPF